VQRRCSDSDHDAGRRDEDVSDCGKRADCDGACCSTVRRSERLLKGRGCRWARGPYGRAWCPGCGWRLRCRPSSGEEEGRAAPGHGRSELAGSYRKRLVQHGPKAIDPIRGRSLIALESVNRHSKNAAAGNDSITGSANDSLLLGGDDNDTITVDGQRSLIWAGRGDDHIDLHTSGPATINNGATIVYDFNSQNSESEGLAGVGGHDTITGFSHYDTLVFRDQSNTVQFVGQLGAFATVTGGSGHFVITFKDGSGALDITSDDPGVTGFFAFGFLARYFHFDTEVRPEDAPPGLQNPPAETVGDAAATLPPAA
jgi:hypothetical protein